MTTLQPNLIRFTSTAASDGIIRAVASGDLHLATSSNMMLTGSLPIRVVVSGCNVMTLQSSNVHVNGGLNVAGALTLASVLGSPAPSESAIDGAGIQLSLVATDAAPVQDRSIRWKPSLGGTSAMLRQGAESNASFWEVKGGGLKITSATRGENASFCNGPVSFMLHINAKEELEVVKSWRNAGGSNTYARVAAFGLGASDFSLS